MVNRQPARERTMSTFTPSSIDRQVRRLIVVFGDQLDLNPVWRDEFDPSRDAVLMIEAPAESRTPPSHVQRTVLFLSAMRHHALDLAESGVPVHYVTLDAPEAERGFESVIEGVAKRLTPERLVCERPGAWRTLDLMRTAAERCGLPIDILEDSHFYITPTEFEAWADQRKTLVLEHFYRMMRKRTGVLMTPGGGPVGGAWNFDKQNRVSFRGAPSIPPIAEFPPDAITLGVIDLVRSRLPDLPGKIERFTWPVTREQAHAALDVFIERSLPHFGEFQDAMWTGERYLYHSRLAAAMNLRLLDPRTCVAAAVEAYQSGHAPINSVEGFVRQILGWREFIRGVYWREGRDYETRNALLARGALPDFYWTGETDMVCMRESLGQVLEEAYGHHIQRLMVTGNFALLAGVHPRAVSDWYLGMYADAVDWVTIPNTIGMSQHADGGIVGTKPYAGAASYINRMSNHCRNCTYDRSSRLGERACPFNTLYWSFLIRHRDRFAKNPRMTMILKNIDRMSPAERVELTHAGQALRRRLGVIS